MAITLDDIKKMPAKTKALIFALLFVLLGYFYYFFFFQSLYEKKVGLDTKLAGLKQQIEAKQLIVREIQKSKKELTAMRESLEVALTKLPERKEIPGLLASLAKAGPEVGLDFVHFEPLPPPKPPEAKADTKEKSTDKKTAAQTAVELEKFYDEIPVKVVISGGFHDTVRFLGSVAKLPRIVNVTDITMEGSKDGKEEERLSTTCVMKTYVFVEKAQAGKK